MARQRPTLFIFHGALAQPPDDWQVRTMCQVVACLDPSYRAAAVACSEAATIITLTPGLEDSVLQQYFRAALYQYNLYAIY